MSGGKLLIPRRVWIAAAVVLAAVACASYMFGRVSCRGEQRKYQLTADSLEEVQSAQKLMLRVKRLQSLLDEQTAAKEQAQADAEAEGAKPTPASRPKGGGRSEADALMAELKELKAAINARHAGHAHSVPAPKPAGSDEVVAQPAIPHASHTHAHAHAHGQADGHTHGPAHTHAGHTHAPQTPGVVPTKPHDHVLDRVGEVAPTAPADAKPVLADQSKTPLQQCEEWKTKYHVVPGASWGHLTTDMMADWTLLDCDHWVGGRPKQARPQAIPPEWAVTTVLQPGETTEVMAVCIAVVTRGISNPSIERLALFRNLLPSFAKTAAPGFEYRVYVAYDVGDAWFDVKPNRDAASLWFAANVGLPLASSSGINATLIWHRYQNDLRKPGPVFNSMTRAAYRDGAHWIYRINDDSIMDSPWAVQLTAKLKSFGRPFGAVGPWCTYGNTAILTHDLTHRTHMQIFDEMYYPPELNDWWMDDWITRVYGRSRTRRLRDVVVRHQSEHGTRYSVDQSHGQLVDGLIAKGREKIVAWMRANAYPDAVINAFQADASEFSVLSG